MEELLHALREKGFGALTPAFDGEYLTKEKDWAIAWEVRDDYGTLVWQEARYGSLDAAKPGLAEWSKAYGELDAYPAALREKIEGARSEARKKLSRALTGASESEERALAAATRATILDAESEPRDEEFIPPTEDEVAAWSALGLRYQQGKRGIIPPPCNIDSATRILEKYPSLEGRIWLDEFTGDVMTDLGGDKQRLWTDYDTGLLQIAMQRSLNLQSMAFDTVHRAVLCVAYKNRRHPVKEWLAVTQWDGVARVERFFEQYMGATDTEFVRAVSKNFFIAMVARIFSPGCKMDNMVVLEGNQGVRKSSALKVLCGDWFTECNEPVERGNNKDFFAVLQGKMLVEIAELDSFSRADVKRIKAIVSTATDRYRPAYGRMTGNFPRTSIFVGTTNEDHYLEDPTGGRRFWPIKTGKMDLESIARDRAQLFAEAFELYKSGASWWQVPSEEARAEQEARRKIDPWEDVIGNWLGLPRICDVTSQVIARDALELSIQGLEQRQMMRIAACMKALGYENKVAWHKGRASRVWVKRQMN